MGDNGNLGGLADAESKTVSEKLTWLLLGFKFLQTEDSEKKIAVQKDDIS